MKKAILTSLVLISTLSLFAQDAYSDSITKHDFSWFELLIIFSPFLTSMLMFLILFKAIKNSDFILKNALFEPSLTTKKTDKTTETTTETTDVTPPKPSSSRFIALLTGLTVIAIALCLISFYMYWYMRTNGAPVFDGISTILLSLGLGIIPYGMNQAAVAIK